MIRLEYYALFLLNFEDDAIIFTGKQLEAFGQALSDTLHLPNVPAEGGWSTFDLRQSPLVSDNIPAGLTVDTARLGYYHHRLIVHVNLWVEPGQLRTVRDRISALASRLVREYVQPALNAVVFQPGGRIEGFTGYPLVLVHRQPRPLRRHRAFPFGMETTSLCFEVDEPFWLWNRRHLMRISMGSSTVYVDSRSWAFHRALRFQVGEELKQDLVNGIYQYCLYPSKLESGEGGIDERLLVRLWEHVVDTTGGTPVQVNGVRMGQKNLLFAALALIVGLLTLDFWR